MCNIKDCLNYGENRYCRSHPDPVLPKEQKIAAKSAAQKEVDKLYQIQRKRFLVAHPFCEARVNKYCQKTASEVHHKRGKVGANYTDASGFLAVCRMCHNWIEVNPVLAKQMGLSESRLKKVNK